MCIYIYCIQFMRNYKDFSIYHMIHKWRYDMNWYDIYIYIFISYLSMYIYIYVHDITGTIFYYDLLIACAESMYTHYIAVYTNLFNDNHLYRKQKGFTRSLVFFLLQPASRLWSCELEPAPAQAAQSLTMQRSSQK